MMTALVFALLIIGPLILDMWTREPGPEPMWRALAWSAIYVASAMTFGAYLYCAEGLPRATLFFSGYAIEKAMSMDNLIIFGSIFAYFGVRAEHQHRVLHWGIVGSAVLRLIFIAAGLVAFFVFGRILDLAFGLFVIVTAWKMRVDSEAEEIDHSSRWYCRWLKHVLPVSTEMTGRFFTNVGIYRRMTAATPLLFCLIALEFTDIAFAFDSVPAVLGITRDSMIAYSSVMFAVVGLRSMYFVLEAMKRYTTSLSTAVMGVLYFVGVKMLVHGLFNIDISPLITVAVILCFLAAGVVASALTSQNNAVWATWNKEKANGRRD